MLGRLRQLLIVAALVGAVNPIVVNPGAAEAAPFDVTVAAGGNAADSGAPGEVLGQTPAIEVDAEGNLWVADKNAGVVRKFAPGSTGDSQAMCEVDISPNELHVHDVSVDQQGRLYVSYSGSAAEIRVLDTPCSTSGGVIESFTVGTLTTSNIAALPDGLYYTQNDGVYRVRFDAAGDLVREPDPTDPTVLAVVRELVVPDGFRPRDVAAGPTGDLYVATAGTASLSGTAWRFDVGDLPVGRADENDVYPEGTPVVSGAVTLAIDARNNLFTEKGTVVVRVPPPSVSDPVPTVSVLWRRCSVLSATEAITEPCIVLDETIIEEAIAAGLLDPGTGTRIASTQGGNVAIDHRGDLFAIAAPRYNGASAKNLVFRVEEAGSVAPSTEVCVADGSGDEGDPGAPGAVEFPLTLSGPLSEEVTVTFEVETGTAESGVDVITGGETTLPAGATSAVLPVPFLGDELVEDDETFTVRLISATGSATISSEAGCDAALGTIVDDDQVPADVMTSATPAAIDEGNTAALSVIGVTDDGTEFFYSWSPDVPFTDGEQLIDADTASATFHSVDDGVFGFTVEVCDPIPTQCATDEQHVTVNNVAPNITNIDHPEGEVGTPVTLEVTFEDPGLADVFDATVDLDIMDTVEPQSWSDVGVPTGNPGEYTLSTTTSGGPTVGTFTGEVCVTDRDGGEDCDQFAITTPPPPPTLAVSGDTVSEGGGDLPSGLLTFSIELSEPTDGDVSVQVRTADGTAITGFDYAPVDTTITIPAGERDATVVVHVIGDLLNEPDETVHLILSAATGAVLDPAASSAVGTIINDDVCDIVFTGSQPIVGTPEDEVICGTDGDDVIDGGGGNDTILAGGGIDRLVFTGNPGPVLVDLAAGTATGPGLSYSLDGIENVKGTPADDELYGDGGQNTLVGLGGDDIVNGRNGNDTISGNQGNDRLYGGGGDDTIFGNNGNDRIYGQAGNDRLHGLDGDDRMYGGVGNDQIFGNYGDDRIYGQAGNDELFGLQGNDRVSGGDGDDLVSGGTADDPPLIGGNDHLIGGDGDDRMFGGVGNDRIYGQRGDDSLSGGDGTDLVNGGPGTDQCLTGERTLLCELP